jgi:predicted DNA-binding mobile mystery protein A
MSQPSLARKHLDQRVAPLRRAESLARPPRGWLRAIRDALGMTTTQLAKRIHVSQSRITRLEQAEMEGSVTLKTLAQAAEGLGCTLVYALVPKESLDTMLRARAGEVADRQIACADQTMKREKQALSKSRLKAERERLIEALLQGNLRRLWDAP